MSACLIRHTDIDSFVPQFNQLHGQIVTKRIYFQLGVQFDGHQSRLNSVRDDLYSF
jgi:hypothetical protein